IAAALMIAWAAAQSCPRRSCAGEADAVEAFLSDISAQAARAEMAGRTAIAGSGGWMFFVAELRALSVGEVWGQRATAASRATNPQYADPLPAIVDFGNQLKSAGIELLIVPVPAKAVIYPEMISQQVKAPTQAASTRLDRSYERFYRLLGERGIAVLDL